MATPFKPSRILIQIKFKSYKKKIFCVSCFLESEKPDIEAIIQSRKGESTDFKKGFP